MTQLFNPQPGLLARLGRSSNRRALDNARVATRQAALRQHDRQAAADADFRQLQDFLELRHRNPDAVYVPPEATIHVEDRRIVIDLP